MPAATGNLKWHLGLSFLEYAFLGVIKAGSLVLVKGIELGQRVIKA